MSYFDTIAPQLAAGAFNPQMYNPWAGVSMLPKSSSNFGAAAPAIATNHLPVDMMNAVTNAGQAASDAMYKGALAQRVGTQNQLDLANLGFLRQLMQGGGDDDFTPQPQTSNAAPGVNAAPVGQGVGSPAPGAGQQSAISPPVKGQDDILAYGQQVANKYGIPWDIFSHQIAGESSWNPNVKNSGVGPTGGAKGIAQFEDGTAAKYGVDVHNWQSSIDGAGRYMADLYKQGGSWQAALTGYLTGQPSNYEVSSVSKVNPQYRAAYQYARLADAAPPNAPTQVAQANTGTVTDAVPDSGYAPGVQQMPSRAQLSGRAMQPAAPPGAGQPGFDMPNTPAGRALAMQRGGTPQAGGITGEQVPTPAAAPIPNAPAPAAAPPPGAPMPVGGQPAPAPVPAPGGPPMAPGAMPPGAQPQPYMPYTPQQIARAQANARMFVLTGHQIPPQIQQVLSFAPGGANDPQAIASKARAQALAQQQTQLQFAGPIAGAQAQAKLRFTPVRPGGGFNVPDANGNPSPNFVTAPTVQTRIVNGVPTQVYAQMTPNGPIETPIGGGQSAFTPQQTAQGEAQGKANVALGTAGPIASAEETAKEQAEAEQKQRQKVIDDANVAQKSQATLVTMQNEIPNFTQGPFSAHVQAASEYLRLINPSYNGQVASYEDFVKNGGALIRQTVKEVSSRAAAQEFNVIAQSLPNPDMSPMGMRRVTNEMMGINDFTQAKAQAQQAWEQQHNGQVHGFETAFQNQVSPYAYIVARMDPTDRKNMYIQLQQTDAGRTQLAKIGQQLQYIKSSGLDMQ